MGKKIIIVTLCIIAAFALLSTGYSYWGKTLVIEGQITVKRPTPTFSVPDTPVLESEEIENEPAVMKSVSKESEGEAFAEQKEESKPETVEKATQETSTEASDESVTKAATEQDPDKTNVIQ